MEDHVVNLVVAVHEGASVEWLGGLVGEEAHHVHEVGQFANGLLGLDVDGLRLRVGHGGKSGDLAVVVAGRLAESLKADRLGDDPVELG
jgi:hypothetical protein